MDALMLSERQCRALRRSIVAFADADNDTDLSERLLALLPRLGPSSCRPVALHGLLLPNNIHPMMVIHTDTASVQIAVDSSGPISMIILTDSIIRLTPT